MSLQVVIVGGGRVGARLASMLAESGHGVRVVESDTEKLPDLREILPYDCTVMGNGTDPGVLDDAGVRNADVLAAVTGSDETNLVVTSLGRFEFAVRRTIARIKDPQHAWMFTSVMGVDVAVNQADLMAHLIAQEMSLDHMLTILKFTKGRFSLVEEKVAGNAPANGKAIRDLALPSNCLLTGVIRAGELLLPRGDTVLATDDQVLAVVDSAQARRLSELLSPSGSDGAV
ncbi:MAG TPA: TrkA family potassium uptake protein [Candidatus Obscuribacterales bacterium]